MTTVSAGASLAGTSIEQVSKSMRTLRNVTIEITNRSQKFTLKDPKTHSISGYCFRPPQPAIEKDTREMCSFSKTAGVARGAVGVLTYKIFTDKEHVRDLAIMFSVPFNYNWFRNRFAFGIYKPNTACDRKLFDEMYYDTGPFKRGEGTGSIIDYSKADILVKGTMSAAGQSVLKVELWDT